jgi:hypothetical protein
MKIAVSVAAFVLFSASAFGQLRRQPAFRWIRNLSPLPTEVHLTNFQGRQSSTDGNAKTP